MDLNLQHAALRAELDAAIAEVVDTSAFVLGPHVERFEASFAQFSEVAHCVGLSNGTDAIELALRALDIGAGDEVVVPAHTFIATGVAVLRAGATPILVDVDEDALLMDPARVVDAISPKTRAVIPVHLYGQAAPADALDLPARVRLVGDGAQCQGARRHDAPVAGATDVMTTSFYPGKNLGALGDGGAVLTDDDDIAAKVHRLRNYGSERKYEHPELGFNCRLDGLQAAALSVKLPHLARWNEQRRAAARRYDELLAHSDRIRTTSVLAGNEHVWHLYTVRVPNRDAVLRHLQAAGIGAGIHYPTPLHLTGTLSSLGHGRGAFPVAERACAQLLSLPLYPEITADQQDRVVTELVRALAKAA